MSPRSGGSRHHPDKAVEPEIVSRGGPEDNASALAPFSVRSFRFQWPADLLTSWAFEMETLILGWYVLVETDSVLLLTAFGSLQFLGTLLAPMAGVAADRLGRRVMLTTLRACYGALALAIMVLALLGTLNAYWVFAIALLAGLVRPSDLVVRNSLIRAIGLSRTTIETARIAGALAGAGLFATLGIGPAYVGVVILYGISLVLTFGVAGRQSVRAAAASPWRELKDGLVYIRHTPQVLALMLLAFLVNLTAFPISMGLLPYVAREIYALDQNGLGHLVAVYACGALLGSVVMILLGSGRRAGRVMIIGVVAWYLALAVFALQESKWPGFAVLLSIGFLQSMAMIAMSVTLLQITPEQFRGRIMGVRMLAVYGLPLGLLVAGGMVSWFGFAPTVWVYAVFGILCTAYIAWRWRAVIWR